MKISPVIVLAVIAVGLFAFSRSCISPIDLFTGRDRVVGKQDSRLYERFGYNYDAAGNLLERTNNGFVQSFSVNTLNQLSNSTRSGTFTVAGTTTSPAANVTVNSSTALRYADSTFASTNHTLANGTNTFTAIAWDANARVDSNTVAAYLPSTATFGYDGNGNMVFDGQKAWGRDVALYLGRKRCGLNLKTLGELAGGIDCVSVSGTVRRREKRAEKEKFFKKLLNNAIAQIGNK